MTGAMKYLRECREKYGPDDPRTKAAFAARAAEYEAGQEKKPGVWYVSFANEDQFLGGVFVYEESMTGAIQKAHRLGINPGGSALSFPPNDFLNTCPEKYRNRLLSKDDLNAILARN